MVFQSGIINEYHKKLSLYYKVVYLEVFKTLKLKSLMFEIEDYKDFNVITFDVIGRGPLLLFVIGIILSCLCFNIELIMFFLNSKKSMIMTTN